MKRIIPILTGLSLAGLITSIVLFFQSGYGLSASFKAMCLFFSAAIALFAVWKSDGNKIVALFSATGFVLAVVVLFNSSMLLLLWNTAIGLHILLIGYTLLRLSRFPSRPILYKVTRAVILVTTLLFAAMVVFRIESNLFFLLLLILLAATSILFVIGQLFGMMEKDTRSGN